MTSLTITRGLPASGKTTFAKQWVERDPSSRTRVNRDDLRAWYFQVEGIGTYQQEELITKVQNRIVEELLLSGHDVIVDDCNLRAKYARAWAELAKLCRAEFEVITFDHIKVDECVQRDVERGLRGERWVGSEVITSMHDRFMRNGLQPIPKLEVADATRQYEGTPGAPQTWLFDIDGTLALMGDRSPYEWHKVGLDTVNRWVCQILWVLHDLNGFNIVIMSGRDESCRDATERWLDKHSIPHQALYMRPPGDNRKDSIVKAELFWTHVAPAFDVVAVFDDRQQVVDMWRGMGLQVAQVAPGQF